MGHGRWTRSSDRLSPQAFSSLWITPPSHPSCSGPEAGRHPWVLHHVGPQVQSTRKSCRRYLQNTPLSGHTPLPTTWSKAPAHLTRTSQGLFILLWLFPIIHSSPSHQSELLKWEAWSCPSWLSTRVASQTSSEGWGSRTKRFWAVVLSNLILTLSPPYSSSFNSLPSCLWALRLLG